MTARGPFVIGLDCGTGGARALVADLAGNVHGQATSCYDTHFPRPGWAEQTPDDWWRAACLAIRAALREADAAAADILAIAADGTSSTLVALDATGNPMGPAILWMDNRASAEARQMAATGDAALARCRAGVSSEWMIPRLLWLKDKQPGRFERASHFVEMADWIALRLSGRLTLGLNQICNRWFHSGRTGGGRTGGWPTGFFDRIGLAGITDRFPADILPLGAPIGPVCTAAQQDTGLSERCLVVCGGTDAYVAMAGLNVCTPGRTAFITGSSHLLLCMTDSEREVPGLFGPHPDCVVAGLSVLEGGQVSSGSILKWWHDQVGRALSVGPDPYAEMLAGAAAVPIGADGLIALDFWQGNRNPHTDYDLQGAIWGLTLRHTPQHILRALVESIAFGTHNILHTLAGNGIPVSSMTVCGGATRSRFLLQMHADTSGLPLVVPKVREATAFGSAIVAAVGAGVWPSLPEAAAAMVVEEEIIEPDMAAHDRYQPSFEAYRATHAALKPLMNGMAARMASTL